MPQPQSEFDTTQKEISMDLYFEYFVAYCWPGKYKVG